MRLRLGLGFDNESANPTPVPQLTALSSPLLASASGGGQPVTLSGTKLTGVTAVKVGSASATSVSSTSTTVTFTMPANTASATPYNITVTTPGGNQVLSAAVYYLPANVSNAWYAAEFYAAGVWTDLIGGVALSSGFASRTAPALNSSWTNGQPGLTFAGTNGLKNAAHPTYSQPDSFFFVADATATTNYQAIFGNGAVLGGQNAYTNTGSGSELISNAGGVATPTTVTITSIPAEFEYYYNGASTIVNKANGGSPQPGDTSGTAGGVGISIGTFEDGDATLTSGLSGTIGLLLLYNGTPTSGERTLIHGICSAIYGTG